MTLRVIRPVPLTDAMLVSTDVPESDAPAWDSGATYAAGETAILGHRIWESLQDANTGQPPATSPDWWLDTGPTNRWAAWDDETSTRTARPGEITYRVRPGRVVSAVAAAGLVEASRMRVRMESPVHGIVYDRSVSLSGSPAAAGWWNWFFGPRRSKTVALLSELPPYVDADLVITLEGSPGLAVGVLLFGAESAFGLGVEYGVSLGIRDYSRKETDQFGRSVFRRRANAKRARFTVFLENGQLDALYDYLSDITATPCLWVITDLYDAAVVYGSFEDFSILIPYPSHSQCELTLQGLT